MDLDKIIEFLKTEIHSAKHQKNRCMDLKNLNEEALWEGELTAFYKMMRFLFIETDDVKLKMLINDFFKS